MQKVEVFQLGDSLAYDVLRSHHERIKRQAAKRNKNPLLEPVQPNQKRMISVDPASFSSMLSGVFDAWYKQRFGNRKTKKTKTSATKFSATTKLTTRSPTTAASPQTSRSLNNKIDKKALFNEFLTLAMDYFIPNGKKKKNKVLKTKQSIKGQATTAGRKRKTTKSNKITHPPILTRTNTPAAPAEPAESASSVENGPSKAQSAESAQAKTQKPKKAKKNDIQILTRPKNAPKSGERRRKVKNTGPPIDPEFLGDINDIRVLQGLPELTADQVDAQGNILADMPRRRPSRLDRSHAHHGHSHGHSHSHDFGHSHGSGLDYGHGIGSGTEAYVQASIADTHRRAHAIAGPLSAGTHRELHRLLKNRERDLRREALLQRRRRLQRPRPLSILQMDPQIHPVVDAESLGELGLPEGALFVL